MKGLLIKDIMLLKMQLKVYLFIAVIGLSLSISNADMGFVIPYVMFCMSLFSITSIAYDEMNHGMTFLLTLPVTKKQYAMEKYLFGIIMIIISAAISLIFVGIGILVTDVEAGISDCLFLAGMMFFVLMIFVAVNMPVQLKYGAQKARIIMFGIAGVFMIIAYGITLIFEKTQVELESVVNVEPAMLLVVFAVPACILYVVSMKISCDIMERKEL